jgi:DNA-binding MarR family transcriptional regulator
MATERLDLQSDTLAAQAIVLNELLNAAMEPALAVQGLKPATFDLLSTIHAAGPDATQAEIARRLGIKPPSLTEALRGLKHLVVQVPSESDNRVKHLQLTPQGRSALVSTIKAMEAISNAVTAGINKNDLATTIEVLKKVNRLLSQTI